MSASAPTAQKQHLSNRERTGVFALVGAGHLMSHVYILTLPPLFALIKTELDISYAALGLLVTMFQISTGATQVPAGFAVDRFGARLTLIAGLLLCAACMGAVGMVDAYWVMVALTTLAGIGNSVFHPANYAILAASVDEKHLGKTFGYHLLTGNLGFAAAPVVMVALAALWDWRTAVTLVGAAGVAVAVCMMLFGRSLSIGDTDKGLSSQSARQPGKATPSSNTRALASPALLVMLAFFTVVALGSSAIQTFVPTVLNELYGFDLATANTALTIYLSASFVGVGIGGFLADRVRHPVAVVIAGMLIGALALSVVGAVALPVMFMFAAMALGGAATGVMRPARDMMVNALTPPGTTGKAFAFVGTGLSIGGAVSPVAFGWLIDVGAAPWVFALIVAFFLMGAAIAVVAGRMARHASTDQQDAATTTVTR
ncbi:MAG: FSR family fosmidomycin resistance protein-like MFS transporter [Gammaproteobacteria bacterium]|jgi:FSR family fosmidomycin resistance protein-like MFS transporter